MEFISAWYRAYCGSCGADGGETVGARGIKVVSGCGPVIPHRVERGGKFGEGRVENSASNRRIDIRGSRQKSLEAQKV